jgi:hypothetical protein
MKKSQRLRLSALLAKGATLTTAEQLEVDWLSALAAANPDAAKDEDEGGFRAALMEAVTGRKTLGADLTAAKARITDLEGQLTAAKSAAPVLPEGALSTADTIALRSQLKEATDQLATANAQLAVFGSALGLKAAETAGKSETDIRAAVDKRLALLAGEKIAELGFPENKLPASSQSSTAGTGDQLADLQAQLASEKDPKKAGELAAKANALRDAQWSKSAGKN